MSKSIPILFLLLAGWIGGGAYLHHANGCCGGVAAVSSFLAPALSIQDGASKIAGSVSNFRFGLSGSTPIVPDDVKTELNKVATYLNENPGKKLSLTGLYQADETNNTEFGNLGLGRAEAMKSYLMGLGVGAGQLATKGLVGSGLSIHKNEVYGGINFDFEDAAGLSIIDVDKFNAGTANNLRFAKSSYEHITPVDAKVTDVFQKTAAYLKANPERAINITGYYMADEKNTSVLPNLGLARAGDIKTMLLAMGVSAKQILTKGQLESSLAFGDNNQLTGGASYTFSELAKADDRLASIYKRLKGKPIRLYFKTNSFEVDLTEQQRIDFSDLIYYLENTANASISTNGHTDDRGDYDQNKRLSRKRAEFAKEYLSKNNINPRQISVNFFGSDEPMVDNDTPQGRSQNRRVEVILK